MERRTKTRGSGQGAITPDFAAKPWYGPNVQDARIANLEKRFNSANKRIRALENAITEMGPLRPGLSDKALRYEDTILIPLPHEMRDK